MGVRARSRPGRAPATRHPVITSEHPEHNASAGHHPQGSPPCLGTVALLPGLPLPRVRAMRPTGARTRRFTGGTASNRLRAPRRPAAHRGPGQLCRCGPSRKRATTRRPAAHVQMCEPSRVQEGRRENRSPQSTPLEDLEDRHDRSSGEPLLSATFSIPADGAHWQNSRRRGK